MKWLIFFLFSISIQANEAIRSNSFFNYHSTKEINLNSNRRKVFDLTLVVDRNSKWSRRKLNQELRKTQRSLGLCGVGIERVEVINVSLPDKTKTQLLETNPYKGLPELALVEEGIPNRRIIGFLNQKIKPYGSAFAMNLHSVEKSERVGGEIPSFRPLFHTFWISDDKVDYRNNRTVDKTYSTLAHEIVHIIGNIGHTKDNQRPNLMGNNDKFKKSYYLNPSQCEEILNYFF